jgi:Double zinc ribbon
MIRCRQCNVELTEQARFCNVCGLPQNPREPELEISTLNVQKAPDTNNTNRCDNCATELPKEARFCAVCGTTQTSKKTSVVEVSSHEPVISASTTKNDESSTVHLQPSMSVKPARTPGLIRPVTPKPSTRSVIPSRPDVGGQSISSQQSIQKSQAPEYPISSPPTKVSSSIKNQAYQPSSSSFMQPDVGSQDKQQIAKLATQRNQAYSQPKANGNSVQIRPQEQIAGVQITQVEPSWQNSSKYESDELSMRSSSTEPVNGKNGVSDSPTMDLLNPASFMATSKAAEQWRKSWRDRQYAEAGPAENVSRGQASVPMPLTRMQHSLARMRAIQKKDKKQRGKRSVNFGTWITIFLMICLIIGLGSYIIVSYMPNSPFGVTYITPATNTTQPSLVLVGTTSQTIKIGQSIQLHGQNFGVNQTIIFLRDTATPIVDTSGNNISTHTDNQGAFDVTISTDSHWSTGSHSIEALDKSNSQNAFQTILVIPAGTATTISTDLSISIQGKLASLLIFKAVLGQGNPAPQQITITNTSGSPLNWTATTSTNNNLNWLMINDNNNYGQLAISQPHAILISVNTVGLKSTDKKHYYLGQINFTINNTQLLTLPVQLQIVDATPEMVFSPNPIIAQVGPGNTCRSDQPDQSDVTLTLINLGTAAISWAVNPDDNIKGNIKFVSNGRLLESGTLLPSGSQLPSGQPGDTVVLTIQCNGVQHGLHYHVSVYANQMSWSESVIVQ